MRAITIFFLIFACQLVWADIHCGRYFYDLAKQKQADIFMSAVIHSLRTKNLTKLKNEEEVIAAGDFFSISLANGVLKNHDSIINLIAEDSDTFSIVPRITVFFTYIGTVQILNEHGRLLDDFEFLNCTPKMQTFRGSNQYGDTIYLSTKLM